MKLSEVRLTVFLGCLLTSSLVFANLPGGGNGTGTNVTLVNNGDGTVTMANGIVRAQIKISTAQILELSYNGVQVTGGGAAGNNDFYWQGGSGSSDTLTTIVDPSTNGGDWAMIRLNDNAANNTSNADAYRYFAMFRGSPGIYAAEDMERTTNAPAGGADIPSLTCKLNESIFNWLGQDTGRFLPRQSASDSYLGVNNGPKEVTLLTSGQLAGQFECKYDYSGDLGRLHFVGWATTNRATNFGLWLIHPSREYFSSGPMHPEIIGQFAMINCTFKSVHFGFNGDLNFTNGQPWSRVCGPVFFYFNQVPPGTANPQDALYADASAQAAAEAGAWPYSWFSDPDYAQAADRGTVKGRIVINDSGNPNASAAKLWVGLAQQPPTATSPAPTDFQFWGKNYQFWTRTDASGNFTISNVIAGTNYTLFAFGPGAIGQFQSQPLSGAAPTVTINTPSSPFSVTVNGGQTDDLGTVTWTPTRVGATVWQIGVPDRDTTEFRHGQDYWHGDFGNATNFPVNWAPYMDYSSDFPDDVRYTNGISRWSADWDYAQPTVLDPATGNLNGSARSYIYFNLPSAPGGLAQASIYFGIASSYQGAVIVQVNGTDVAGSTGFFPYYSRSSAHNDAMIRMTSHGVFSDWRINFSAGLLHQGQNVIMLNMRKGGYFADSTMYDYLRLELTGYVPPAPAGLTAIAGNGAAVLDWPASSGATSYTVSRSTTSGGGYIKIATNVIGPVVGSDVPDATYTDNSVVNGTTYYYVVKANNPNGSSTNTVEAAATPSVTAPPAPVTPADLMVTPGNLQATLTWHASPGAATYTIRRTVLTPGAVTTLPDGSIPTNVVNRFVTTTNYTDTGLQNNVTYAYTVSAANANGQSAASTPVPATPSPASPATPTGLTADVVSNEVGLSWNPVADAEDYRVQRAISPGGPYVTLNYYPTAEAFYSDAGLNYNTTYYYTVAASNLGGVSTNSSPVAVTTPPAPPATLSAIPGNGQALLSWGGSSGATSYVVQRSVVNGGPYSTISSTTDTSYLDTGLVNGTTYYYVVYAVGPSGTSPLSPQASVVPSAMPQMIKSDTTTMDTAGDWSGVMPATNQVGIFNNIISAANEAALTLGGDVSLGGLIFTNDLNGPVTVAAGNTLTLGGAGIDMSQANQNVMFGNAISLAASQIWNVANNRTLTVNGAFTGAGHTVIKTGGGTLYLGTSVNDESANIQVNAGTVWGAVSSTIRISLNGGTFVSAGSFDANPITVLGAGGLEENDNRNRTWMGDLSGSGPLTVNASAIHTWKGDNSAYTGTLTLLGSGALRLSSVNAVSATTAYVFNGGTMNANDTGLFNLGSLSGSGTINTASGENFSIGALGANTTFSGIIAGAGFVEKAGTGTLGLSGANTYSGGTMVDAGTLMVNNTVGSGTGSGTVAANAGGVLGGAGAITGAVTINSNGTLAPGDPLGTLTLGNNLTLTAGSATVIPVRASPLTNAAVSCAGTLTEGGTLMITNLGGEFVAGERFQFFSASSFAGAFGNVVLPPLSGDLAWNNSRLNVDGSLWVVNTVPPAITQARLAGTSFIASGSGGTPDWYYEILATTNLALPVAQWMPMQTNQFDASGNFIFTNAINAGWPQTFYRLQSQ